MRAPVNIIWEAQRTPTLHKVTFHRMNKDNKGYYGLLRPVGVCLATHWEPAPPDPRALWGIGLWAVQGNSGIRAHKNLQRAPASSATVWGHIHLRHLKLSYPKQKGLVGTTPGLLANASSTSRLSGRDSKNHKRRMFWAYTCVLQRAAKMSLGEACPGFLVSGQRTENPIRRNLAGRFTWSSSRALLEVLLEAPC